MTQDPPYHEPELLRQIAAGSGEAFRRLFDAYQRRIYSYAFKFTSSHEAAEDTVQNIFLALWDRRHTLPDITHFNAYIHRMAHNEVYHAMRRLARVELAGVMLAPSHELAENADTPLLSAEVRSYIKRLVDQLTPKQREAFILSREHGLKYQEIAGRMGVSVVTVKTHIIDALKFLRTELGKEFKDQAIAIFVIWQLGNL